MGMVFINPWIISHHPTLPNQVESHGEPTDLLDLSWGQHVATWGWGWSCNWSFEPIEIPGRLEAIFENFSRSLQTKIGRWQLTFHIKKTQLSFEHVESLSCLISIGFIVSQPVDCVQEQCDRMDAYFSPPPTTFWVVWMGNFVPVILWKFRVA